GAGRGVFGWGGEGRRAFGRRGGGARARRRGRRGRGRYGARGVDGRLKDATRPPRRKPLTAEKIKQVVQMTLRTTPPDATHWSLRSMAAATDLSRISIQRILSRHGQKPHLIESFKTSREPNFADQANAVVRVYLEPP